MYCCRIYSAFFPGVFVFLRHNCCQYASMFIRNIVCLLVIFYIPLEAGASPPVNVTPELVDSGNVLLVKVVGNRSEGAVGVFSEVEKSIIKGKAVSDNGSVVLVNRVAGTDSDNSHSESACDAKQGFCIGRDEANYIHDGLKAFAIGMWIGVVLFFVWMIEKPNAELTGRGRGGNNEVNPAGPRSG